MGVSKMRRPTSQTRPAPLALQVFRTTDVARILGVSPARVRAVVRAGLCRPSRRGRAWEFGFQELVRLRTAHELLSAKVPPRRVRRALTELSAQLPPDRPLSGVRIYADGRQVVARDGRTAWRPDSGQVVFSFAVDDLARAAGVVVPVRGRRSRAPVRRPARQSPLAWFERALRLERKNDVEGARAAYHKAVELDPDLADAYINLGRLTHAAGDPVEAARLYHHALQCAPDDPVAHYNLAIALEDQRRFPAAVSHYQQALSLDPEFADAHFNLARLLDRLGRRAQAMRHLFSYKQLTEG
jgi:tetratricopeptide (TPR) repeat protein